MKWLQAFQSLLGFGLSTPLKTQSWGGTQSVMILASTLFFVQLIHSSCQSIYWPPVAATMPSQEDKSLYLPMLLHGDGGAFQSSDSVNVISMRSFLSSANVATSQLLLLAIPKACCNKSSNSEEDTMTALWNVLQWSFNAMWCGKWPEKDHLGEAWHPKSYRHSKAGSALNSNGYCGWLFGITCDGEYQQNEFGLQGHSYNQCCFSCKADKDSIPHNDYRPNALWRTTCIKHKGTCPTNHPIAGVKGVVGETWAYDILHVLELGVTGHLLANITFDFVMKPTWPGSQEERLVHLQEMIMHQYQEQGTDHSCRIRRLTWSNFCQPQVHEYLHRRDHGWSHVKFSPLLFKWNPTTSCAWQGVLEVSLGHASQVSP